MNRRLAMGALAVATLVSGCFFIADTEVEGKGVGAFCEDDDDCHGSDCEDGVCTTACSGDIECPDGSVCANGTCQVPMKVGFLYVGVTGDEGWTQTHEVGRRDAIEALGYLTTETTENVNFAEYDAEGIHALIDGYVEGGARVVVSNTFDHRVIMAEAADKYPDVEFLTCSSNVTDENLGSYFGRSYQAWYLAGYAAGRTSSTGRLGFVGSYVNPEVVRHINAFTLGARRADPDILVEVRWEGFWFDLDNAINGEDADDIVLAKLMIEGGCDVIAHNMDLGLVVEYIEENYGGSSPAVRSIGNDNADACDRGKTTCIGVPAWNWGPLYVEMFDAIHRGQWDPTVVLNEQIETDASASVVNFLMNEPSLGLKNDVADLVADLAKPENIAQPFVGPLATTGQREGGDLGEGEIVSDAEMASMCWFVDGVVEKIDPTDPSSAYRDARVPDGSFGVPREAPEDNRVPYDCNANK